MSNMPNLTLVAAAPANSTYVYEVIKDYTTNQLIIDFTKGYNGMSGSYKLPVGWIDEANPFENSPMWAGIGSRIWCSNQWAPAQNIGIWRQGANVSGVRNSLNNLAIRMFLGRQNPNAQTGFGLVHIYCRHRPVINQSAHVTRSDHEEFVTRIRNALSSPVQANGIRRIWHNTQTSRYGLLGTTSGKLYLIVVSSTNGSITTIFTATTTQGLSQVLGSEGFGNQSTLWKYSNAY
ncbi:MAG: hypothetical protein H6975_07265 [Gammaproteobacteria bacterium]|nr:hypothetical protein [Gammaproteobacteria bacterium]